MKKRYIVALSLVGLYVGWVVLYHAAGFENASKPLTAKQMNEEITSDGLFLAINKVRQKNGVTPLKSNALLQKSAKLKCDDMKKNNYYEHENPKTGKEGYTYITDVGQEYSYASENLNAGVFKDAKHVIDNWMLSEPHKAAILDPRYTETGFAMCTIKKLPGDTVFVNHFIEPVSARSSRTVNAQETTQEKPKKPSCDPEAKALQEYYYGEILKTIEVRYKLESTSPDSFERSLADSNREARISDAKYNLNINLVRIGCF